MESVNFISFSLVKLITILGKSINKAIAHLLLSATTRRFSRTWLFWIEVFSDSLYLYTQFCQNVHNIFS